MGELNSNKVKSPALPHLPQEGGWGLTLIGTLHISKHVMESIRNIARGVGIN